MTLFVANWKMNKTRPEARAFATAFGEHLGTGVPGAELVLAPPFTSLDAARDPHERWSLAGQDVAEHRAGAFTGEVSAAMLADAGCRYVIVGHSERRTLFGEDGPDLARKLERAREHDLVPIYCLGETLAEREAGQTAERLSQQVETLADDPADEPIVVAYEPVWAIGTGVAATSADVAAAVVRLAALLSGRRDCRILYGGSVTPGNCSELLERSNIDGFLVGGASLDPKAFWEIVSSGSDPERLDRPDLDL